MMEEFVGKRCEFSGHRGTIRYFGEVASTSGYWFGVEWDEKRGKHNGTHANTIYFKCQEGHGSFIRTEKVNLGITLKEAVKGRYEKESENEDSDLYLIGNRTQKILVEAVGFDKLQQKLRQLGSLKKISVIGLGINRDDNSEKLCEITPDIRQLDIASNLFCSWYEIVTIIQPLCHLEVLNVSENILTIECYSSEEHSTSASLKTLFANRMKLNWNQIIDLLDFTPNLQELHICFNGIQNFCERYTAPLHGLRLLNLEGNEIDDWNEVLKLSCLKSLETLILNNNKISKIYFPTEGNDIGFLSLDAISLSDNKISEWSSIDKLSALPCLKKLKFKSNPLSEGKTSYDLRQELIARLKDLKVVNGSEIPLRERMDSELLYVKQYGQSWRDSGGNEDDINGDKLSKEFQDLHPRFLELVRIHGPPISTNQKAKTLKDKLIPLRFQCPDHDDKKIISKKVPKTMTIQQLRLLLQRLFKVQASLQRISYLDSKTQKEVTMEENLRDLEFYSISQNDIVLVRT